MYRPLLDSDKQTNYSKKRRGEGGEELEMHLSMRYMGFSYFQLVHVSISEYYARMSNGTA